MKKLITCTIAAVVVVLLFKSVANGQCSVKIIGTPAIGNPLRAGFQSSSSLQVLIWQLNGTTVFNSYKAEFSKKGITVAGGTSSGNASNQLFGPGDVYADDQDNVYVLDGYNNRVQKWEARPSSGTTVAGGNGLGGAPSQLYLPQGFYVDQEGSVLIADLYNNRVQKWVTNANTGVTVAGGNSYGSAPNQLNVPHDVYADQDGNLYITDGDNNRVQKWAPGATTGVTVAGGNGPGNSASQLNSPFSIFADAEGNLYISDRANDRVQKWAPGATTGTTVAGFSEGSDSTQLNDPRGIYVSKDGTIYVADYFNNRIQKYIPGMNYGITVAGDLKAGKSATRFSTPSGVFVSAKGDLYVADEGNNRVQKFTAQNTINTKYTPKVPGTYQVIAVFANGCRDTSEVIIVPESYAAYKAGNTAQLAATKKDASYQLFPNPATSVTNFSFVCAANENYVVEVADLTGRVIRSIVVTGKIGNNMVNIATGELSAGVYVVSLKSKTAVVKSFKLYKE